MSLVEYPKISLPLRSHLGCDPLCDECKQWQRELGNALSGTVKEAQKAFAEVLTKRFPELVEITPYSALEFSIACEEFCLSVAESSLFDVVQSTPARSKPAKVVEMQHSGGGEGAGS